MRSLEVKEVKTLDFTTTTLHLQLYTYDFRQQTTNNIDKKPYTHHSARYAVSLSTWSVRNGLKKIKSYGIGT